MSCLYLFYPHMFYIFEDLYFLDLPYLYLFPFPTIPASKENYYLVTLLQFYYSADACKCRATDFFLQLTSPPLCSMAEQQGKV